MSSGSLRHCSYDGSTYKLGISDFTVLGLLGKGAFGKVFLVEKNAGVDGGELYAMKVLSKSKLGPKCEVEIERHVLSQIQHCFIVKLFYAFQTNDKLYLILEYISGGELFDLVARERMLLEDMVVYYSAQIVLSLEYLHKNGIIYRDLKPENILLDRLGHVKLTDFGLCSNKAEGSTFCGTIEYMSPEIVSGQKYDKSIDWWSLGILIYEMLSGKSPFKHSNRTKMINAILKATPVYPSYFTPFAKELIVRLLNKKTSKRITVIDIKKHKFFRTISWEKMERKEIASPFIPLVKDTIAEIEKLVQKDTNADDCHEPAIAFRNFSFNYTSLLNS